MSHYDFTVDLVQRAGEILRASAEHIVTSQKGNDVRDVVTNSDLEVNVFLIGEIKRAYPAHRIYSEEGAGTEAISEYEWTLDPVDGSSNFSRGIPHFAICVGLVRGGVPIVGAVYNPITNELFSFEEGRGAFLNTLPIRVSEIVEMRDAYVFLTVGRDTTRLDWGVSVHRSLLENAKKTRNLGSAALDLCFLAAGREDMVIYGTLTTRDIACAIGIVRAAGGEVYTLEGTPVELRDTRQTIIATATPTLFTNAQPHLYLELLNTK